VAVVNKENFAILSLSILAVCYYAIPCLWLVGPSVSMICGSDGILTKPINDNGKIVNGSLIKMVYWSYDYVSLKGFFRMHRYRAGLNIPQYPSIQTTLFSCMGLSWINKFLYIQNWIANDLISYSFSWSISNPPNTKTMFSCMGIKYGWCGLNTFYLILIIEGFNLL
jgi:hypothetical protein